MSVVCRVGGASGGVGEAGDAELDGFGVAGADLVLTVYEKTTSNLNSPLSSHSHLFNTHHVVAVQQLV
jgi:2-methylaconitate cis-trans-isomerase PrpF